MATIPPYVQRLFSTAHLGAFAPRENAEALARIWPMNGDRAWAGRCLAWLDDFLASDPTADDARTAVRHGWHDGALLTQDSEYLPLLRALRDRIAREIGDWQHEKDCDYPFECSGAPLEAFGHIFGSCVEEDFTPEAAARCAWELRARPELIALLIAELKDVFARNPSDAELNALWRAPHARFQGSKLRDFLHIARGALETARYAADEGG